MGGGRPQYASRLKRGLLYRPVARYRHVITVGVREIDNVAEFLFKLIALGMLAIALAHLLASHEGRTHVVAEALVATAMPTAWTRSNFIW